MTRKHLILLMSLSLIAYIDSISGQTVDVEILHQTTGEPICDVEILVKDIDENSIVARYNSDKKGEFYMASRYFKSHYKATLLQDGDTIFSDFNLLTFKSSKGKRQIKVANHNIRTCVKEIRDSNNSSEELEKMRDDLESIRKKNDDTLELLGKIFEDTHSQIDKQIQENFKKLSDLEQKVPVLERDIKKLRQDSVRQRRNYNILEEGAALETESLKQQKNKLEKEKSELEKEKSKLQTEIDEILVKLNTELRFSIPVLKGFSFLTYTKNKLPTKKISQWHLIELKVNFFDPRNLDRRLNSYMAVMTIDMGFNRTKSYPLYFSNIFTKGTDSSERGLGVYYFSIAHINRSYLRQCKSFKIELFYTSEFKDKKYLIGECIQEIEGKMENRKLSKECRCWEEKY